ncbi:MAG: hypothetical protein HQ518_32005 [Rhodopirellula sp.]|nr:hypothetical protein [Rhodopirellula sp.]
MTTRFEFNTRLKLRMQSSVSWRVAELVLCSLLLLPLAVGCGGGEDDFGPTVIRSSSKKAEIPTAPIADSGGQTPTESTTGSTEISGDVPSPESISGKSTAPEVSVLAGSPAGVMPVASEAPKADSANAGNDDAEAEAATTRHSKVARIPVAGCLARTLENNAVFAGRDERKLIVFDQYTGKEVAEYLHSGESNVSVLAASSDGSLIIAGMENGTVKPFRSIDTSRIDLYARRMIETAQRDDVGMKGHEGIVTHAFLLPGEKQLVTGGADGQIHVWEIGAGDFQLPTIRSVRAFSAHPAELLALQSLSENRLVSVGDDGKIRIWSVDDEDASPIEVASTDECISAVAVSPDESTIALAYGEGSIRLVSLNGDSESQENDAKKAVPETETKTPTARNAAPEPAIAHPGKVRCVALSADAKLLMTGCDDGMVRLWDVATRKELERTSAYGAEIVSLGYSTPTASRQFMRCIFAADAKGLLQWWSSSADPAETRRTRLLTRPVARFNMTEIEAANASEPIAQAETAADQTPEVQQLHDQLRLSVSVEQLKSNREALLKLSPQSAPQKPTDQTPPLTASFKTAFTFTTAVRSRSTADSVKIGFSTDGTQLAAGRQETTAARQITSTIHFWDLPTGVELRQWKSLATELQQLQVVGHGQNIATLPSAVMLNRSNGLTSSLNESAMLLARSTDGKHFAIGERGAEQALAPVIRLVDSQTLQEVATFAAYESYPTALAFSPDGMTLVASIRERKAHKLIALDAMSLKQKQIIEEHGHDQPWLLPKGIGGTNAITLIMFSQDSRHMLTYGEYQPSTFRVSLWESKNSKWVEESDRRAEARKKAMVTEADPPARFLDARGSRIVLAVETGYRILDLQNKRLEREIELERSPAKGALATIAPSGSLLAVGTEQGKVQLWQLDKEKPILEFPAHLGPVVGLKFAPDSSHLATAGEENVVHVWNLADWANRSRRLVRQ